MAFAQGSRSSLAFQKETTFGVLPGTPDMRELRSTGSTLNLMRDTLESEEIRSDRQTQSIRIGNRRIEGDINFELAPTDYDAILESAFFGVFSSGELKAGVTPTSLLIEEAQLDLSTKQYRRYLGCYVNTLQLSFAVNEMVKCTASIVGKDQTVHNVPFDSTITPASGSSPFDAYQGTLLVAASGLPVITSIELTIENNIDPLYVIGASSVQEMGIGRCKVTGSISAYLAGSSIDEFDEKYNNETDSSIAISLLGSGSGNTYTFTMPRVRYLKSDKPRDGEGAREISVDFQAIKDSVSGTNLILTKS